MNILLVANLALLINPVFGAPRLQALALRAWLLGGAQEEISTAETQIFITSVDQARCQARARLSSAMPHLLALVLTPPAVPCTGPHAVSKMLPLAGPCAFLQHG